MPLPAPGGEEMAPFANGRHYEATTEEVWLALKHLVNFKYKGVRIDEMSKGISFKTGMTAFTAGQNFEASVLPSGDGALLSLFATSNMSTQLANGRAQSNVAGWLYENVGDQILKLRAQG